MSLMSDRWRILIVEDEALLAEEIADRLHSLGHEVIGIVDTGQDAIDAAESEKPDVILMDIRIKGPMDGIETARIVHQRFNIPIVFSTAHSDRDTLNQAQIPAQFGYIIKPFREQDLMMAIRLAMHRFLTEQVNQDEAVRAARADAWIERDGTTASAERLREHEQLVADLAIAFEQEQFVLHYQPIVDLHTNKPIKAEALLRWQHPTQDLIQPMKFIHLLEESGLIHEVGNWVFDEADRVSARIATDYGIDIPIGVNVSAVQFVPSSHSVDWEAKLKGRRSEGQVAIEITESVLVDDPQRVRDTLHLFREHHLPIAIDDFGTGFSSLSYLKIFAIDYLKVDRSFTQGVVTDRNDRALTEAIIAMAHSLGCQAIAEGVETSEQRDALAKMGCEFAQGHFFSKPLPEQEFVEYLLRV